MDVIRAADPAKERMAVKRLEALGEEVGFTSLLPKPASDVPSGLSLLQRQPAHKFEAHQSIGAKFEAAILSSLIENMFSSNLESSFGSGVAGSSFKSLFAEQIANQIARSGGLGVATLVDKHKQLQQSQDGKI